jgi:hypothetical protein
VAQKWPRELFRWTHLIGAVRRKTIDLPQKMNWRTHQELNLKPSDP